MKRLVFLSLLVALVVMSCKSNYAIIGAKDANYIPYYLKVYEADSLFIVKDYQRSFEILDSLFQKFEPLNQNRNTLNLCEYEKYIKLKNKLNKTLNKDEFKKLIINFGYMPNTIINDFELNQIKEKLKISNEELNGFYKIYLSTIDYELRKELEEMAKIDQECRRNFRRNKDSLMSSVLEKKIVEVDSLNNIKIKEIFKKYNGYPYPLFTGNCEIKEYVYDIYVYMDTIILHQCTEGASYDREFYVNFLYNEMKKGKFDPVEYAICYDRIHVNKETEKFLFSDTTNKETMSNEDKKIVNKIRKEFGVFSVEYQVMKEKLLNK